MKKCIYILGIIIVSHAFVSAQTKKVLFLGNSYTFANNLPEKVSLLASSFGDSVYFDSSTPGGYKLMDHVTNPTTLAKINAEDWDFVVIQAQSQEPAKHPTQLATEVLPYATQLNELIKSNNSCTETVFYMTWGRKYGDAYNCATWPPVCTFLGMQERLMSGYMTMAEENNSTVAPVGLSWKHAMDNDPDSLINLYSGDNSHPSLSGSYLTACVMYATLFQKSPFGSDYFAGLSELDALFLQQMANDVVLNQDYNFTFSDPYTNINYDLGWESWFDLGNITVPGFSYTGNEATYNFFDNSLNADSYLWDFGDGGTSVLQNPSHTYTGSGNYIVTQSASNACFENDIQDTINLTIDHSGEIAHEPFVSVSPNPGNGHFELLIKCSGLTDDLHYEIVDPNGKLIQRSEGSASNGEFRRDIDLSSFARGSYGLRIYHDNSTIYKTLIIQ